MIFSNDRHTPGVPPSIGMAHAQRISQLFDRFFQRRQATIDSARLFEINYLRVGGISFVLLGRRTRGYLRVRGMGFAHCGRIRRIRGYLRVRCMMLAFLGQRTGGRPWSWALAVIIAVRLGGAIFAVICFGVRPGAWDLGHVVDSLGFYDTSCGQNL